MVLLWPLVSNSCPSPLSPMIYGPSAIGTPFHLQNKNSLTLVHFNKDLMDLYFIACGSSHDLHLSQEEWSNNNFRNFSCGSFFLKSQFILLEKIIRGSWIQIMIFIRNIYYLIHFLKKCMCEHRLNREY